MEKTKIIIKKSILVLLLLAVSLARVYSAAETNMPAENTKIRVTLINQDPDPAEPGTYIDVRFKFENIGIKDAEDITVEFLDEFPFTVVGDMTEKIGSVWGRQLGDRGVIIKYRLKLDNNAVEGENKIKLRYQIKDKDWQLLDDFVIDVQTHDAVLSVLSVVSDPEIVEAGKTTRVDIKLKNMADSLLKDVQVKLDLDDVSFAPLDSTNEKTITRIESKKQENLTFNLIAEADAVSQVYKVPMTIEYWDELGKNYTRENVIGLVIGSKPDLVMTLDNTEIQKAGTKGDIDLKFVNKDSTDVKFLNVKLKQSEQYEIISSPEDYLGNIDSDDYETAEFEIYVKPKIKKNVDIIADVEYKDSNGNKYDEEFSTKMRIYSTREMKKIGLAEKSNFVGFIILILIVVGGWFGYKKWKKRKKR